MKALFALFLIALLFGIAGCSDPEMQSVRGFAQGTTYNVSYWSEPEIPSGKVQAAARQTLDRIDIELSNYRDDSAIEVFNRAMTTEALRVPPSLVELVRTASEVGRRSDGCYDLSIRPLFALWGFGDSFRVPSQRDIDATLAGVGMDKLTVIDSNHLAKVEPDVSVDVSSIAQGYSTAQIAASLQDLGIEDYLVEVGGELLVKGRKPDNEPWRVAIERPLAGERAIHKVVEIEPGEPMSVVTSGTYRHYYDENGRRYSHILDARTGKPVQHDLLSVTVLDPDPTLADAWSTALLCLGTELALEVAEAENLAVMLIEADGEDWRETYSEAFESSRWRVLEAEQ